jgi:hypothetical protein
VKGLELVAALGERHAAVGEHAVHVEHEQADALRARPHVTGGVTVLHDRGLYHT